MKWPESMSDTDKEVLEASGWGGRQGFGVRPAVLVVDVAYGFTGERREPLLEAVKRSSMSCGERAWDALDAIEQLLGAARGAGVPVIYSKYEFRPDGQDMGGWRFKHTRAVEGSYEERVRSWQIHEQIEPHPEDHVVIKQKPSAFFGTNLPSLLVDLDVDQLIIVGCVTSGCVRATVTDAFSYNYRVAIPEEGTFDRVQLSHEVALLELDAKYADVMALADVIAYLNGLGSEAQQARRPAAPASAG